MDTVADGRVGVAGLIGAVLAMAPGRRIGRWTLALACTVVGFAFTAFQDVGDWVTYSDHSLAQLGLYVGQGLGFDAVHAAGCLVFALAFGPALARSVSRFADRIDVTWLAPGPAVVPILAAVALGGWLADQAGSATSALAASSPLSYLLAAQNSDGGIGSAPGQASSELYSAWAAMGVAAAGVNPQEVAHGGSSLTSYLASGASGQPTRVRLSAPSWPCGRPGYRRRASAAGTCSALCSATLPGTGRCPIRRIGPPSQCSRCEPPASGLQGRWCAG